MSKQQELTGDEKPVMPSDVDNKSGVPATSDNNNAVMTPGTKQEQYQCLLEIAEGVHNAGLAPDSHDNPQTTAISMLAGTELGFQAIQSLSSVHVIKGKATLSAQAMKALVYRHGAGSFTDEWGEDEQGRPTITVTAKRSDNGDTESITWTLVDAKRAGLLNGRNWKQYPRDMLWSRATASVCRKLFPDICGGLYTPGEAKSFAGDDKDAKPDVEEALGMDEGAQNSAQSEEPEASEADTESDDNSDSDSEEGE